VHDSGRAATPTARLFAWIGAALFVLSLSYFVYSYWTVFGMPAVGALRTPALVWNVLLFSMFALHHTVFARERIRGAIEPRLLRNLPLDVRVVLAWDADATDVDLHVIDPNGDEVYYGRNLSWQGGTISRDATGGYGPEEFALKVAKPGKYRVEANFFGHRQQVLTSSTGLMLWLSSGFGTAAQQDKRTTLRLGSQSGQRVVVGEFEVKKAPG